MLLVVGLAFVVFAILGVPVAIAIGMASAISLAFFSPYPPLAAVQKMLTGIDSYTLLAIPLFILAGELMNTGGVTRRIFGFAQNLVGRIPGGLGHANVVASMIFAGMTGSAVAEEAGLGIIEIKAMTEQGFDLRFSAAVTGASSLIGPIIPPSIPFVLYASIAEVSVGKLFLGGIVPGVLMGLSIMVLVYIMAKRRNYPREREFSFGRVAKSFITAFPSLFTPIIIIGGMLSGIFTATEAAAVTVGYAFILSAFVYRSLKLRDIPHILINTVLSTAVVTFILSAASAAGWIVVRSRAGGAMADCILSITNKPWVILALVNVLYLLLGCVLDTASIMILTLPMLIPLLQRVGIDLVHFGVVGTLNLMIGLMTPPFGMALFVLSGITKVSVEDLARAMAPFIIPIFIVLILITYIPSLVMAVPNWLMP